MTDRQEGRRQQQGGIPKRDLVRTGDAVPILGAEAASPEEALKFVWSLPVATIASGVDSLQILQEDAQATRKFQPLSETEREELLERTRGTALNGEFEPFRTDAVFDGPVVRKLDGIK